MNEDKQIIDFEDNLYDKWLEFAKELKLDVDCFQFCLRIDRINDNDD